MQLVVRAIVATLLFLPEQTPLRFFVTLVVATTSLFFISAVHPHLPSVRWYRAGLVATFLAVKRRSDILSSADHLSTFFVVGPAMRHVCIIESWRQVDGSSFLLRYLLYTS